MIKQIEAVNELLDEIEAGHDEFVKYNEAVAHYRGKVITAKARLNALQAKLRD